jgi:hypothetical protein
MLKLHFRVHLKFVQKIRHRVYQSEYERRIKCAFITQEKTANLEKHSALISSWCILRPNGDLRRSQ